MDLAKVSSAAVAPHPVAAKLQSEEVFAGMKEKIDANKEKATSVNGIFLWNITSGGKQEGQWSE